MPDLESLCLRCGKCCVSERGNIRKRCNQLALIDGTWTCRIYNHRLGMKTAQINGTAFYCGLRENQNKIIEGCPYNYLQKIKQP